MTMRKQNGSPEKIQQALDLLNEAAHEKRAELYQSLEGQYDELMKALSEITESIKEKATDVKKKAEVTIHSGQKKIEDSVIDAAEKMEEKVHQKPWAFLGAVAVSAFVIGAVLSRKK